MIGALLLIAALVPAGSDAKSPRSHGARQEFVRQNPCPATHEPRLPCPGYVIDHVKPLACGGRDRPENMQWQTAAEAKAKDRWERVECRTASSRLQQ